MTFTIPTPLLLVLLIASAAFADDTIELLRADVYVNNATGCGGDERETVPFGVNGVCNTFNDQISWMINCTSGARDVYASRDCSGSFIPFALDHCITGAATLGVVTSPSVDFSCTTVPKNKVVIMTIGGACPATTSRRGDLASVVYSFALIVNTCLPIPHGILADANIAFGLEASHYKITVQADGTVTFSTFLLSNCAAISKVRSFSGKVNKCTTVSGATSSRRQLASSNGAVFETVDADTTLEVGSDARAISAGVFSAIAIIFALFASV